MAMPLAGCKDSDVLTQKIVDQSSDNIDYTLEPIRNEAKNAEHDELLKGQQDESDREETPDQNDPEYDDEDQTVDEATPERTSQEHAQSERNATQGGQGEKDTTDGSGKGTGSGGTGNGDGNAGDSTAGNPSENEDDEPSDSDNGNPEDSSPNSPGGEEDGDEEIVGPGSNNQNGDQENNGNQGQGETYDNTGNYEKLPENTRSVAAVGQCATIVQMLSGGDSDHPTPLVAADSDWVSKVKSTGVFPGEGADSVVAAWTGDGTSAGSLNTKALLAANPDVVLIESDEGTLTEDDQEELQGNGIDVVIMPALGNVTTTDSDITTAVRVVGELLKGANTQYDTVAAAQSYVSMHDECIENVVSANGGYSMKRYNGQIAEDTWIYQPDGENGLKGISTTRVSNNEFYLTAFADAMGSVAYANPSVYGGYDFSDGIALSPYRSGNTNKWGLLFYYLQCAGVIDYAQSGYSAGLSTERMILTYTHGLGDLTASGDHVNNQGDPWGGFSVSLTAIDAAVKNIVSIGDDRYPAIVTRNDSIAKKIARSRDKTAGFYHPHGSGYEIWVLPSGFSGEWVDGSVESYLAAPWAYASYHDCDLSSCDAYVNDFYDTFYRAGASGVVEDYGSVY